MAWYLDDCSGDFRMFDHGDYSEALRHAKLALDAARDFERKSGWRPFWADSVEIRKGPVSADREYNGKCEARNAHILKTTTLHRKFKA